MLVKRRNAGRVVPMTNMNDRRDCKSRRRYAGLRALRADSR